MLDQQRVHRKSLAVGLSGQCHSFSLWYHVSSLFFQFQIYGTFILEYQVSLRYRKAIMKFAWVFFVLAPDLPFGSFDLHAAITIGDDLFIWLNGTSAPAQNHAVKLCHFFLNIRRRGKGTNAGTLCWPNHVVVILTFCRQSPINFSREEARAKLERLSLGVHFFRDCQSWGGKRAWCEFSVSIPCPLLPYPAASTLR